MESMLVQEPRGETAARGVEIKMDSVVSKLGLKPGAFDPLLNTAKAKIECGDLEAADEIYAGLLLLEPQNYNYLHGHANCALLMHQYEIANLSAVIMTLLDPENPYGFLFVGQARIAMKKPAEAKPYLETALELACKKGNDEATKRALQLLIFTKDS